MVKGYISAKERATNGLKLLLRDVEPFAQVQASWRFLNNENVKVEELCKTGEPIAPIVHTQWHLCGMRYDYIPLSKALLIRCFVNN